MLDPVKSRWISEAGIIGSLYVVLGLIGSPLGFGPIQIRIASSLIPLIPVFGSSGLVGVTIGHLIVNLGSPLGVIDLLSPFVLILPRILLMRGGSKWLIPHILSVGLWVSIILNMVYGYAVIPVFLTVTIGEIISEGFLGLYLAHKLNEKLPERDRYFREFKKP